jgi:hypothetical protein
MTSICRCSLARQARITLVDIDGEALERAVRAMPPELDSRIEMRPGVDLLGLDSFLGEGIRDPDALHAAVAKPAVDIGGPFDVVASTCLLSQLIDCACAALGDGHPGLDRLALAGRDAHLRLLASRSATAARAG